MKISCPHELPEPKRLFSLLQSSAMMDAILSQEFGEPVYSFTQNWSRGRSVGVVQNGQGDNLFIIFDKSGCFMKGWVHDIAVSTDLVFLKDVHDSVPQTFLHHFSEPAFVSNGATFYAWNDDGASWHSTSSKLAREVADGSEYLLGYLKLLPEDFRDWATDNYELDVSLEIISNIYNFTPVTKSMLTQFLPQLDFERVRQKAARIGYPVA